MNDPSPLLAAAVMVTLMVGLAAGVCVLNDRWKRRERHQARAEGRRPGARTSPVGWTVRFFFLYLILMMALGMAYNLLASVFPGLGRRGPNGQGPRPGAQYTSTIYIGGFVLGAAWILFLLVRDRDRAVASALKRAAEGDTEGGIAELQRAIAARGPSFARLHTLGVLLGVQDRWAEAYERFLAAEPHAKRRHRALSLAVRGVALWKLGRSDEAIELQEEACRLAPQEVNFACNACLILADLGRYDEAAAYLERAEETIESSHLVPKSAMRTLQDQVEACRKRLAEAPKAKERALFDEI